MQITHELLKCPECGITLAQNRRFGPPQVRCGNCDVIVKTNLPYWYETFPVPMPDRIVAVVKELLNPSALGLRGIVGIFIHLLVIYPMLFGFTLGLGLLYYPLYRLVKMVTEMQTYRRTEVPPVWGKKVMAN